MTTMTSSIGGLLGLMAIALAGGPSLAQDKCQACVNKETADCVRRVQSSPAPAPAAGKPAPVEASGASFCPQSARNSCKASGDC
jgi:hypothetical protein